MAENRFISKSLTGRALAAWCLAVIHACLWCITATAAATTFTASLDQDSLTVGETATLSLTVDGASLDTPPSVPGVQNLQIAYRGPSSQVSIVNGQMSSRITHSYSVTPTQPGDFTIPAITVKIGAQTLSTQPLKLKAVKASAPPPEAIAAGTQLAFLKISLPRTNIYLNEFFAAEAQLYLNNRIQSINQLQFTSFPAEGFTVGKMIRGKERQAQVGNTIYTVVPIFVALKPIRTGSLTLGPATMSLVVEIPSGNRRRDPFFEQFGIGMFGNSAQKQLTVAAEGLALQCLPLPSENVPPGFRGAVGSYTMAASAGPTNVTVGDPITVRVQISGRGDLDSLTLPEQSSWANFKTYPPTSKVETTDALGLQGSKSFEQIVVPQNAEIKELPPISFSFFDPDQNAYRTLTHPKVGLIVRPGGALPPPTVAGASRSQDAPPPTRDIVHIKLRPGALARIAPPLPHQAWFLALQAVPLLAFGFAFAWRKRSEALANNPRLRRQRHVDQLTREGLAELRQLASDKNSDAFFATTFRLLQEQLGERLEQPASAITEAVIEERLESFGAAPELCAGLRELFLACNQARYAPVKSSQELNAIIPRLESVLKELRSWTPRKGEA